MTRDETPDPRRAFLTGREHARWKLVARAAPWLKGALARVSLLHELRVGGALAALTGGARVEGGQADLRAPLVVERGLRGEDAAALRARITAGLGEWSPWTLEIEADPSATAVFAVSGLLPEPRRVLVDQPSFNRTWRERAGKDQLTPGARLQDSDAMVHVTLDEIGPDRVAVLRALRAALGRPLKEVRALADAAPGPVGRLPADEGGRWSRSSRPRGRART